MCTLKKRSTKPVTTAEGDRVNRLILAAAIIVGMTGAAGAKGDPPGMTSIPVREVGSGASPVSITTSASFKRNDDLAIVGRAQPHAS